MGFVFNPISGQFDYFAPPVLAVIDTIANILSLTPTAGKTAYATDNKSFYVADGTNWRRADLTFEIDEPAPDMGYGFDSKKNGYYSTFITDKKLYNVTLQGNALTNNGGLRIDSLKDPDTFEIYLRGAWQSIIYDLTTEEGDFRHTPLSQQIYIWNGSSVLVGLNGRSVINEYSVSMGAYPMKRIINGGTF